VSTYIADTVSFVFFSKKLGLTAVQDGKPVRLTFHDLRYVFATELTDSGANIRDVQRLLGHGSVTVTEIYTAPSRGGSEALKLPRKIIGD